MGVESGRHRLVCSRHIEWCCALQARDPIPQFRKWVLEEKILSEQQLNDLDKEVEAIVEDSVQFADESPKPVSPASTHLYQIP